MQNFKVKIKEFEFKVAENSDIMNSPEKIHNILKDEFSIIQEKMLLLVLDNKNSIIDMITIFMGSMNSINITPDVIYRHILACAGNNFIIAHNHPSGNTQPSGEDIEFTEKIKSGSKLLNFNMLDHIVFTDTKFYSFRANDLL